MGETTAHGRPSLVGNCQTAAALCVPTSRGEGPRRPRKLDFFCFLVGLFSTIRPSPFLKLIHPNGTRCNHNHPKVSPIASSLLWSDKLSQKAPHLGRKNVFLAKKQKYKAF